MYTMVLMMAVTSGGEVSSFGHRNKDKGCNGGDAAGCSGYVVAAPTGCTGSYAPGYSSYAPTGCNGADAGSCHGKSKGGFLGLRGKRDRKGGSGCNGVAAYSGSCYGGTAYSGSMPYQSGSCHGGVAAVTAPDCGACPPAGYGAPVVGGGTTPPVIMPKEDPKPKFEDPKPKPKTEDPKSKTESN